MMSNYSAYIMNESLLGELETDEVVDDNGSKEAISVSFEFYDRTLIVDRFIVQVNAFFDNLIERNIAIEYKKDTTGGIRKYIIDCKFRKEHVTAELIVKIMMYCLYCEGNCNSLDGFEVSVNKFDDVEYYGNQELAVNWVSTKNHATLRFKNILNLKEMFPECDGISVMRTAVRLGDAYGLIDRVSDSDGIYRIYIRLNDDYEMMHIVDSRGYDLFSIKDNSHLNDGNKYSSGMLLVQRCASDGGGINYIDRNGKLLSEEYYSYGTSFDENERAVVRPMSENQQFLIDKHGRFLSDGFSCLDFRRGGYYYVKDKVGYFHILDADGKDMFGNKGIKSYKSIRNGFGWVYCKADDEFAGDKEGFVLVDEKCGILYPGDVFDNAFEQTEIEGVWRVVNNGAWNFYTKDGKLLLDRWVGNCRDFCNGYARVYYPSGWNYVDESGNVLCVDKNGKPDGYGECYNFDSGGNALVVSKDDMSNYNYIGTTGKLITNQWFKLDAEARYFDKDNPPIEFYDGFARIRNRMDGSPNFISREGNLLFDIKIDSIVTDFHNGCAVVIINNFKEIVDKNGNILSTKDKDYWHDIYLVSDFENGCARIKNSSGLWNIVRSDGTLVSKEWFFNINDCCGNVYVVENRADGTMIKNFLNSSNGKFLFKKWLRTDKLHIDSYDDYFKVAYDKKKYNIIFPDGTTLFDDWSDSVIEYAKYGVFRVGADNYVDNKGNLISTI